MPFITARDGTQLFWREWGQGTPILFLNSLGCNSQMWDYQMVAFAEQKFRCIGFDRRGHGRSDQPAGGYDFDTFADDTARLIEQLDLSGLTMISHSMAAGEIVRYLTRHGSSRVARAIFLSPMTPMLLQTKSNPNGISRVNFEALWTQWKSDYPKWVEDATAPFFVPETSGAMMRWIGNVLQSPLPVNLACSRMMVEADFRDEMQKIAVPTLIVHGERDRSAPIEVTGIPSAELIPGCRFLTYKGAPHGLMYTHMEQLHADILQFVQETR
jgi:pimeloyl-ACP methyl ester carboxylesterase